MQIFCGTGVFDGIALAPLRIWKTARADTVSPATTPAEEEAHFREALDCAQVELAHLAAQTRERLGAARAEIFDVHQMMLADPDFLDFITAQLRDGVTAVTAVRAAGSHFSELFRAMDDDYMRERAADVNDVCARLTEILSGAVGTTEIPNTPCILYAEDLSPSQTISLAGAPIAAFVTAHGSTNSHTAILARAMGIPAIVGVGTLPVADGIFAAVDATNGTVYLAPDEQTITRLTKEQEHAKREAEILASYIGRPARTRSGREIALYANIGGIADVGAALASGADGIGLYRSEFLYLENPTEPSENVQFESYRLVLERMQGKNVIVRTLDIGADKRVPYLESDPEPNPALGVRGLRLCLARPALFSTQLRALWRASAYGNLSVMFPMVTTTEEVEAALAAFAAAREEVLQEGHIVAAHVPVGIMIETPAAALTVDLFAPFVDFFSIGTNDLTQYTLAADRESMAYHGTHPAVLRLIREVAATAKACGKWVGICGEMAADRSLLSQFLDWGIAELSVSPGYLPSLRKAVCETED